MKSAVTYLTFDGTCRDAMTFYSKCLGGELHVMSFADMPAGQAPPDSADRIMHARLKHGASTTLMASDSMPGHTPTAGTNFSVAIEAESVEEIDSQFAAMSEGGTVRMPLADAFWGARFGMLTDKFGIQWMFNFEKPKQ